MIPKDLSNSRNRGSAAFSNMTIILIYAIAGAVVAWWALDRQSLWIDEFGTWKLAHSQTFADWRQALSTTLTSDAQLPFYHFIMFFWMKFAPETEIGIRSSNILFLFITLFSIGICPGLSPKARHLWAFLICISCFLLSNINEARPYVMMISGSTLLTSALVAIDGFGETDNPRCLSSGLLLFSAGTVVAFGASPSAALFIFGVAVACVVRLRFRISALFHLPRHIVLLVLLCFAIFVLIASFVVRSTLSGILPDLGNQTSIATLGFAFVEVLGGAGFTPGRDQLRIQGLASIQAWQWGFMALFMISIAWVLLHSLNSDRARLTRALSAVCLVAVIFVVTSGYAAGFRVVGRHFAFLASPVALLLCLGILAEGTLQRARGVLTVGLLLTSSLIFHFSPYHKKENFRAAVGLTSEIVRSGDYVWWNAERMGLEYYGVKPTRFSELAPDGAQSTSKTIISDRSDPAGSFVEWRGRSALPVPSMIVVQRPETNDKDGFFEKKANEFGLTNLQSFRGLLVYSKSVAR